MKRKLYIFPLCMALAALFVSCEKDNYDAPDGLLTGKVIDHITGKPIVSEPKGFRIEMKEVSWAENPTLLHIKVKPDGTFTNTKIPAATYEITPVEGPFVIPESKKVEVKSKQTATVDFTVTPYISFKDVSIVKEGNKVKATFTMIKNVDSATPRDYRVIVSSKTPYVGVAENAFDSEYSTAEILLKEEDFGNSKMVELDKLVAGKTYYIRVSARCDNPTGRYNFTEIVKIQL